MSVAGAGPYVRARAAARTTPIFRFRIDQLRLIGWRLFAPAQSVEWYGHGLEFIPIPQRDGWCQLVRVPGEVS
jgi:hypothetical protein